MRLIHSPHDGGWYWERWDRVQSLLYPTREAAERAYRQDSIEWED